MTLAFLRARRLRRKQRQLAAAREFLAHLEKTAEERIHAGPFGTAVEIKTIGLYCCTTCGKRKAGNPAQEAPAQ